MKKIIAVLSSLLLLSTSLFAKKFFEKRYFEFEIDVPFGVSNNAFGLSDIMKKEVVIDLTKIANDLPKKGWNAISEVNPNMALNLNLPLFNLGFEAGVDIYGKVGVGKGLFDFFGKGYDIGDTLNIALDFDADVFLSAGVRTGFNISFFKVEVNPSVFLPIVHIAPEDAYIELKNDENGDISMDAKAKLNAYSIVNFTGYDMGALSSIPSMINSSMGFDIAGKVHFTYFDNLDLWGSARIPFIPGHLSYVASVGATAEYKGNISDLISGASGGKEDKSDSTETTVNSEEIGDGSEATTEEEKKGFIWQIDDIDALEFNEAEKKYYINRPMKFDVYATFALIPNFVEFTGGLGFGIRNPFAKNQKEVEFYPEYYLASQVGLANIIVVTASSEYTDQIFKHQLALKFNIRLIELDVGASLQSASFASSLKVAGVGGFINVFMGF